MPRSAQTFCHFASVARNGYRDMLQAWSLGKSSGAGSTTAPAPDGGSTRLGLAGGLSGGDPQLAGLGQDLVLERGRGLRVDRRVGPAAALPGLTEHRDLHRVGPQ